ncbi:MAG: hypothetical protein U5L00_00305 [Desulfovermiculus sp.]|nr:hypothetical protein [Desulfovermiculus sp.]
MNTAQINRQPKPPLPHRRATGSSSGMTRTRSLWTWSLSSSLDGVHIVYPDQESTLELRSPPGA